MSSPTGSPTGPMMTFEDVKVPGQQPGNQNQQQGAKTPEKEKKVTKYWLNVGLVRGDKLLTLPMGIPLDDLTAKPVPGPSSKNQDFRNLRIGEKQLWDAVLAQLQGFKPGEARRVDFVCEIRMIDEKAEPTAEEITTNPYSIGENFTLGTKPV